MRDGMTPSSTRRSRSHVVPIDSSRQKARRKLMLADPRTRMLEGLGSGLDPARTLALRGQRCLVVPRQEGDGVRYWGWGPQLPTVGWDRSEEGRLSRQTSLTRTRLRRERPCRGAAAHPQLHGRGQADRRSRPPSLRNPTAATSYAGDAIPSLPITCFSRHGPPRGHRRGPPRRRRSSGCRGSCDGSPPGS